MAQNIKAIAVFQNKLKGTVIFEETHNGIKIKVDIEGLSPGKHGFHIHETGNLLDKCKKCKGHFNPTNQVHGGPNSKNRHIGDLGNITANQTGICKTQFIDNKIKLTGRKFNIIGRTIVIHKNEDNLGVPKDEESLMTGKAGERLDCAVIGYMEAYYF